jgi:hypothetical protein
MGELNNLLRGRFTRDREAELIRVDLPDEPELDGVFYFKPSKTMTGKELAVFMEAVSDPDQVRGLYRQFAARIRNAEGVREYNASMVDKMMETIAPGDISTVIKRIAELDIAADVDEEIKK